MLPPSRVLPGPQRGHHAEGPEQARQDVGDREADPLRGSAGAAGERHESGLGLHDLVESGPLAVGAAAAETGDGQRDQPRVEGAQVVEPQAETFEHPRTVVLHENVRLAGEPAQPVGIIGGFEVQDDGALVAVGAHEVRRLAVSVAVDVRQPAPAVVTGWRFDLHDVGAGVGHHHGRVWTGQCPAQIHHTKIGKRSTCAHPRSPISLSPTVISTITEVIRRTCTVSTIGTLAPAPADSAPI